jgi:hypothetical protein
MVCKNIETEILHTDMIESSVLMVHNKDMIITSDRINIHTMENSICIPAKGAIKLNNICKIDKDTVHITGDFQVDKEFKTSVNLPLVKRIPLDEDIFLFDESNFQESNHFILDCSATSATGFLIIPPYQEYTQPWPSNNKAHLYIMNISLNTQHDSLVDIDIIIKDADITIKMHSRNSSLSLLWIPEGHWIIHSIGYKTTIINDN